MWDGEDEKVYSGGGSVVQGWVFAPSNTLIWRELPWSLAFEEEDAFTKRIVVVVAGGEWTEREEQEEEEGEDTKCGKTPWERESIARHFSQGGAKKDGNRRGTYSRKASLDSRLWANELRARGNITGWLLGFRCLTGSSRVWQFVGSDNPNLVLDYEGRWGTQVEGDSVKNNEGLSYPPSYWWWPRGGEEGCGPIDVEQKNIYARGPEAGAIQNGWESF